MNQPFKPYCPDEAIQKIVQMMKSNQVRSVTLAREGSGDSGDREEFWVDLENGRSGELSDEIPGCTDLQAELSSYLEYQEGACEASYDKEGGRFECNLSIYSDEVGEEFVLSAGASSFHGKGENVLLSEEFSVEQFVLRFKDSLGDIHCASLLDIIKTARSDFVVESTAMNYTTQCSSLDGVSDSGLSRYRLVPSL